MTGYVGVFLDRAISSKVIDSVAMFMFDTEDCRITIGLVRSHDQFLYNL